MATKTIYLERDVQNWLEDNKDDRSISKLINELVRVKFSDNTQKEAIQSTKQTRVKEVPKQTETAADGLHWTERIPKQLEARKRSNRA